MDSNENKIVSARNVEGEENLSGQNKETGKNDNSRT